MTTTTTTTFSCPYCDSLIPAGIKVCPKCGVVFFTERYEKPSIRHLGPTGIFSWLDPTDITWKITTDRYTIQNLEENAKGKPIYPGITTTEKVLCVGAGDSYVEEKQKVLDFPGTVIVCDRIYPDISSTMDVPYVVGLEDKAVFLSLAHQASRDKTTAILSSVYRLEVTRLRFKEKLFFNPELPEPLRQFIAEKCPAFPFMDSSGNSGMSCVSFAADFTTAKEIHMLGIDLTNIYERYLEASMTYLAMRSKVKKFVNLTKKGNLHAPFIVDEGGRKEGSK